MITGVVGKPGNGKTVYLVRELVNAYRDQRLCMANFTCRSAVDGSGLEGRPVEWERVQWLRVIAAHDAVVALDEAHMWFPAREYKKQTADVLAVFQQHRKAGLDLYWAAQHEDRIDVAMRELTAVLVCCKRVGPFVMWSTFDGVHSTKVVKKGLMWIKDWGGKYFTEERVLGRDERSVDPVVGCTPNVRRLVAGVRGARVCEIRGGNRRWYNDDAFSHVVWQRKVFLETSREWVYPKLPIGYVVADEYYQSPYGGRLVPWVPLEGAVAAHVWESA